MTRELYSKTGSYQFGNYEGKKLKPNNQKFSLWLYNKQNIILMIMILTLLMNATILQPSRLKRTIIIYSPDGRDSSSSWKPAFIWLHNL